MSREVTAESVGRDVLGPVVAEFCLRLWTLSCQFERPDDAALLFCARGGLRLQFAHERFLTATGLRSPVPLAPLMVSRLAAIRPALVRGLLDTPGTVAPAAAGALDHEFGEASLARVVESVSGLTPPPTGRWDGPYRTADLAAFLADADGSEVVEALTEQADLFARHLRSALGGRRHAVLVDTGLYGTTRDLLAGGFPDLAISSALMVRSVRGGLAARDPRTAGLSVQARDYAPWQRRTAVLRYWHFVEWLFEPDLPSVRTFTEVAGVPRSNLEVEGWRRRLPATPGSPFAGVLDYLNSLTDGGAERVLRDADRAWDELHRAIVRPDGAHGRALRIGTRSHDFGRAETWAERDDQGPLAALRGSTMWREGEIARSGSPLRGPLLVALDAAYGARHLQRALKRRAAVLRRTSP